MREPGPGLIGRDSLVPIHASPRAPAQRERPQSVVHALVLLFTHALPKQTNNVANLVTEYLLNT